MALPAASASGEASAAWISSRSTVREARLAATCSVSASVRPVGR